MSKSPASNLLRYRVLTNLSQASYLCAQLVCSAISLITACFERGGILKDPYCLLLHE